MLRRRPTDFSLKALAFEVVVVVLGVLIALGVGELQQTWEERQRARETAQALHAELAQNCLSLQVVTTDRSRFVRELDSLLRVDPLAATIARLPVVEANPRVTGRPYLTHVTFDAAQAAGTLRLFAFETVREVGAAYTFLGQYEDLMRAVTPRLLDAADPERLDLPSLLATLRPVAQLEDQARPVVCAARDLLATRYDLDPPADTESSETAAVQGRMLPDLD